MGNRAVITASTGKTTGVGIYVHWNGGLESVQAFLDVAKARGYRDPDTDDCYAMGRLCGLIHEFMDPMNDCSLGIGLLKELDTDNWDNGVYVVGPGWKITKRWGKGSQPLTPESVAAARATEEYKAIVEQLSTKPVDAKPPVS